MKKLTLAFLMFCLTTTFIQAAGDTALTAFKARDLAEQSLNAEAKGKLIEIYGAKNAKTLLPTTWQILFYDPYANQDGRMIKISNGHLVGITDGYSQMDRMRMAAYKTEEIIDSKKLKIDSDAAFEVVRKSALLDKAHVTNVEMRLVKSDKGNSSPVWYITLYGENAKDGKVTKYGKATVSATTGQILKMDIDSKKIRNS